MKTNKYIITADWHLRADKPRCRLDDDWLQTQKDILKFIYNIAHDNNADIIIVGDIYNSSNEPNSVQNMFLLCALHASMSTNIYILAGNHELPYHNWQKRNDSAFGIIWNMTKLKDCKIKDLRQLGKAFPFGIDDENIFKQYSKSEKQNKLSMHTLVYKDKIPPYIKNAVTAQELLDKYSDVKWIFTGDNHHKFIYKNKNRYVINPGCIIRQTADMINYKPSVYLIDFDNDSIKEIEIPDKKEMVTDEYIILENKRNDRIESFVSSITVDKDISFDFIENIKEAMKKNDIDKDMEKYINDLIMEVK